MDQNLVCYVIGNALELLIVPTESFDNVTLYVMVSEI